MRNILLLLLFVPLLTLAQKRQITLEDIYKKGTFRSEYFSGFAGDPTDSLFDPMNVLDESGKRLRD